MNKVAIITIESVNYGNRLQNYALQKVLSSFDLNVETIRRHEPTYKSILGRMTKECKMAVKWLLKTKDQRFFAFDKKIKKSSFVASANSFDKSFENKYDYYVVGSDQVWNPYYQFVGDTDLLLFTERRKKISYAASFGVDSIPFDLEKKYKEALSDFSHISVREDAGAKIIERLTEKKVNIVLDPTFLISAETWRGLEKKPRIGIPGNYTMVYMLGNRKKVKIGEKDNNILDIMEKRKGKDLPIGPAEFLYIIDHAERVVTDSFHATVFSLLFHVPCKSIIRDGLDMSSRIKHLSDVFGLTKNYLSDGTFVYDGEKDTEIFENNLEIQRGKSINYIVESFGISNNLN